MAVRALQIPIVVVLGALAPAAPALAVSQSGPPGGTVEGPHGAIPGFPVNSCAVCHEIAWAAVGATSNWEAVKVPDQICLGCHTEGPTFGTDDPLFQPRPNATPAANHASLVTGSSRFSYGDFGAAWWDPLFLEELHCTSCHDPHRTFSGASSSTANARYIRDQTDRWRVEGGVRGFLRWRPYQEIRVVDQTGGTPVASVKTVSQAIAYNGVGDLADGIGELAAERDICEVCHTLTDHHQVDGTAPGGQSHFDGEDCTGCHTHTTGFAPGGQPVVGPHAAIPGFPPGDCQACHGAPEFPGGPGNPQGRPSVLCATCHDPGTVANLHAHSVTGNVRFEYELECTVCHDQHGWTLTNIDGNDNLSYVKARIDEQITVVDNTGAVPVSLTKTIQSDIVFDSRDDFADGDALFGRDICVACHTLTNHHQNDGDAPGGQSHHDGGDCASCHLHADGFAPPGGLSGDPLTGPHASIPGFGFQDCLACHQLYPTVEEMKANSTEVCFACHSDAWTITAAAPQHLHSSAVTGTSRFDYAVDCATCHAPHGWTSEVGNVDGTTNIRYIRANIDDLITVVDNTVDPPAITTKNIDHDVVFIALQGPGSFADGDARYTRDICVTCHTLTDHHRNDGMAPDQSHNDGTRCTDCHLHTDGFGGFGGPHPQAVTDCANCHLGADGQPDLQLVHGNDCALCHTTGFPETFLGPRGTWDGECDACHNPFTAETGNMDEPSRGHRCVACHGAQRSTANIRDIHKQHAEAANCVVCHGFIPDVGTAVGSGNRQICITCHGQPMASTSLLELHERHVPEGLGCLECHGGQRPPVDVTDGPLVGGSRNVCEICHSDESPSEFQQRSERLHKKHSDKRLDCGACHAAAHLQDDRLPMPGIDDAVRSQVDRAGFNECRHCHKGGKSSSVEKAHERHVADQWQWCYNCHLPSDGRPAGDIPPVTRPDEACLLCHGDDESYLSGVPFAVHEEHAKKAKCYACHQTTPPLTDWPRSWLGGTD